MQISAHTRTHLLCSESERGKVREKASHPCTSCCSPSTGSHSFYISWGIRKKTQRVHFPLSRIDLSLISQRKKERKTTSCSSSKCSRALCCMMSLDPHTEESDIIYFCPFSSLRPASCSPLGCLSTSPASTTCSCTRPRWPRPGSGSRPRPRPQWRASWER